jgi:3-methyl-2-oxobutanoate hydroxymethyltransferase
MAITIPKLAQMKREGEKIVGVVVYEHQSALIADRAGADIVSLGDSCGHNLLGQENQQAVTLEEILMLAKGVRRGVKNALFSCDLPFGSYQVSAEDAVRSAVRLVKEAGVDCVKLEVTDAQTEIVAAIARAGIPVFAQFGLTPQTSAHLGGWESGATISTEKLVETAKALEQAGASILDLTWGGAATGPVTQAVKIPVMCGLGNDGSSDGQIRTLFRTVGLGAGALSDSIPRYANVAKVVLEAVTNYADDIRAGKLPLGS